MHAKVGQGVAGIFIASRCSGQGLDHGGGRGSEVGAVLRKDLVVVRTAAESRGVHAARPRLRPRALAALNRTCDHTCRDVPCGLDGGHGHRDRSGDRGRARRPRDGQAPAPPPATTAHRRLASRPGRSLVIAAVCSSHMPATSDGRSVRDHDL